MCQFLKNTKTRIDIEKNTRHDMRKTRYENTNCQVYFDVIIIGTGLGGLRFVRIKVCCVDPSPLSVWPNNYGVLVDEFESLGLVDCLDKIWPMICVYIDDHETKYLDRPYGRVLGRNSRQSYWRIASQIQLNSIKLRFGK